MTRSERTRIACSRNMLTIGDEDLGKCNICTWHANYYGIKSIYRRAALFFSTQSKNTIVFYLLIERPDQGHNMMALLFNNKYYINNNILHQTRWLIVPFCTAFDAGQFKLGFNLFLFGKASPNSSYTHSDLFFFVNKYEANMNLDSFQITSHHLIDWFWSNIPLSKAQTQRGTKTVLETDYWRET